MIVREEDGDSNEDRFNMNTLEHKQFIFGQNSKDTVTIFKFFADFGHFLKSVILIRLCSMY